MVRIISKGGAGIVSGSEHYIEVGSGENKIGFLIDAGYFQGSTVAKIDPSKNWYESQLMGPDNYWNDRNRMPDGIDYDSLDAIFLTHGHLDHSGKIGQIIHNGFNGDIVATEATVDIVEAIEKDAYKIQKEDCKRANSLYEVRKNGWVKKPTFELSDIVEFKEYFAEPVKLGEIYQIEKGDNRVVAVFQNAGHIIGASSIQFYIEEGNRLIYLYATGDIGKGNHPILKDPEYISIKPEDVGFQNKQVEKAVLLIESTYGGREHERKSDINLLVDTINKAYKNAKDVEMRKDLPDYIARCEDELRQLPEKMREELRHAKTRKERRAIRRKYVQIERNLEDMLESYEEIKQKRYGDILIPVFSVDRLQEITWDIVRLQKEGEIPGDISLYIDTTLGEEVTEIYMRHTGEYNDSVIADLQRFGMKNIFDSPNIYLAGKREKLPEDTVRIILTSSGMMTGGKSPYYASRVVLDPASTIIISGYQGEDTPGRDILDGKDEVYLNFTKEVNRGDRKAFVRISGKRPVHCDRASIRGLYSGHADMYDLDERVDYYVKFVSEELGAEASLHLVHGDREDLEAFYSRITAKYGDRIDTIIQEPDKLYDY